MADFGGFNIETPQEVLARTRQRISQGLGSNNINQRTQAQGTLLLQALFGNPEAQRAQQRVDAAEAAFSDLEQQEGEDDIAFRQRQTQAFFDRVKDVDPALAAQAAERLTGLQNERIERQALMAAERRRESNEERLAAQEEDRQARVRTQNQFNNTAYIVDPATGQGQAVDLGTEEGRARLVAARQNNQILMTREEYVRQVGQERAREEDARMFNRSTLSRKIDTYEATTDALSRFRRVGQLLSEDPDILTKPAQLEKGLSNLANDVAAGLRKLGQDSGGLQKDLAKVRSRISPAARARGVTDSMVVNLAYSLARSLDPGGRLSDDDINRAVQMIGGEQSDPSIFAQIAMETARFQSERLDGTFRAIQDGLSDGERNVLGNMNTQMMEARDDVFEIMSPFLPKETADSVRSGRAQTPQPVTPSQIPSPTNTRTIRIAE